MKPEFAGAVDLAQIAAQKEQIVTQDEIRSRYLHMVVEPETVARAYWVDDVLSHKPDGVSDGVLFVSALQESDYVDEQELFRQYITRVAKGSANQFGVKDVKLVIDMLQSEVGVGRFRKAVIASCGANYPTPYNSFDAFTHRFGGHWNSWYPLFIDTVVPGATTEELDHLHIEQRIHLPSEIPSGLILPS